MSPREEWYVTVEGIFPVVWHRFCVGRKVKPLYIELSNGSLQLMCGLNRNPNASFLAAIGKAGGRIVRVKHEVQPGHPQFERPSGPSIVYYECHVKIDGPYADDPQDLPSDMGISRDLFRPNRWYLTKRRPEPFDAANFAAGVKTFLSWDLTDRCRIVGVEYEACLTDTNKALDEGWL